MTAQRRIADDDEHQRQHADHERIVDERWVAHGREHDLIEKHRIDRARIYTADRDERERSDDREKMIHQQSHAREHAMTEANISKASDSMEQRLSAMNEFRQTLSDQSTKYVSRELHDSLQDRMIALNEATLARIVSIEKSDVKGEGRALGQGAVIAAIVGSVAFAATLIGLIIVIADLVNKAPT